MSKAVLLVQHKAKPGQREQVEAIWARHVKPNVEQNPNHEVYYFCRDDKDPDVVFAFQVFSSREAIQEFLAGAWYPEYLDEVAEFIAESPQISEASPVWIK